MAGKIAAMLSTNNSRTMKIYLDIEQFYKYKTNGNKYTSWQIKWSYIPETTVQKYDCAFIHF